jgi:hypothetical protein
VSAPVDPRAWGSCLYCGDAVPPDSNACPICGAENPIRAGQAPKEPKRVRRRIWALGTLRSVLVFGAIALLVYAIIAAELSGPPVIADPLTHSGTYYISSENYTVLSGSVQGGDYILGNWSVMVPFAGEMSLVIYNSTEFTQFQAGDNAANQTWVAPTTNGQIDFSALYTNTFYFVFENPYPASSGLNEKVYISTAYTPDVNSFDGGLMS